MVQSAITAHAGQHQSRVDGALYPQYAHQIALGWYMHDPFSWCTHLVGEHASQWDFAYCGHIHQQALAAVVPAVCSAAKPGILHSYAQQGCTRKQVAYMGAPKRYRFPHLFQVKRWCVRFRMLSGTFELCIGS